MSWNPKILNDQANRLGNDLSRSGILDLDSSVDILYKLCGKMYLADFSNC